MGELVMKSKIYLVRHSISNTKVVNDYERPLTEVGIKRLEFLKEFFIKKSIDYIYSSPFLRAIDTIKPLSVLFNLNISVEYDFRERKITDKWIDNFDEYSKLQWNDFNYKFSDGESLNEVKYRNINKLNDILDQHRGKNIVIGTHGTSMSTILNHFDNKFDYYSFKDIKDDMPLICILEFDNFEFLSYEIIKYQEDL
jgi:2,3-bisphosphoglycerate-dependent phosphoglycerate mutase